MENLGVRIITTQYPKGILSHHWPSTNKGKMPLKRANICDCHSPLTLLILSQAIKKPGPPILPVMFPSQKNKHQLMLNWTLLLLAISTVKDLMSYPEVFQMTCPGCGSSAPTALTWSSGKQTSSATFAATQGRGPIRAKLVGKDSAGWTI